MPIPTVDDTTRDRIRRMAGGTAVRNISDLDAVNSIEDAYGQVQERTGIAADATGRHDELRRKAVRLFAASDMASRFADMEPQVRMWIAEANRICDSISRPDTGDVADEDIIIEKTDDSQYIEDWRNGDPTVIRKRVVALSEGYIVGHLGFI